MIHRSRVQSKTFRCINPDLSRTRGGLGGESFFFSIFFTIYAKFSSRGGRSFFRGGGEVFFASRARRVRESLTRDRRDRPESREGFLREPDPLRDQPGFVERLEGHLNPSRRDGEDPRTKAVRSEEAAFGLRESVDQAEEDPVEMSESLVLENESRNEDPGEVVVRVVFFAHRRRLILSFRIVENDVADGGEFVLPGEDRVHSGAEDRPDSRGATRSENRPDLLERLELFRTQANARLILADARLD